MCMTAVDTESIGKLFDTMISVFIGMVMVAFIMQLMSSSVITAFQALNVSVSGVNTQAVPRLWISTLTPPTEKAEEESTEERSS